MSERYAERYGGPKSSAAALRGLSGCRAERRVTVWCSQTLRYPLPEQTGGSPEEPMLHITNVGSENYSSYCLVSQLNTLAHR